LKDYLQRFYAEAAQVPLISDAMKLHCAIEGVRPGTHFALALSEESPATMDDFRQKAARYIRHEQHAEMARALRVGSSKQPIDVKDKGQRRDEFWGRDRERVPFKGRFEQYTPLNTSVKKILEQTMHADMAEVK